MAESIESKIKKRLYMLETFKTHVQSLGLTSLVCIYRMHFCMTKHHETRAPYRFFLGHKKLVHFYNLL